MKNKLMTILIITTLLSAIITFFLSESSQFRSYIRYHKPESAFKIAINLNAPVISMAEIKINAPKEKVWQTLTLLHEWPQWQSSVTKVNYEGKVEQGTFFSWKSGGLTFKSKIHTMETYSYFGWTGEIIGAQAIHNWEIEDHGDHVLVKVEESLQGPLPKIFRSSFQKNLDDGMQKNLMELKLASEKTQINQ